jgi:hypothetical protein
MTWFKSSIALAILSLSLTLPPALPACPACADAIANSAEGEDGTASNLPVAMNQSIYLMVSTPYILLAVVGFMIYRGVQKNAHYLASLERASEAAPPTQA